MEVEEGGKAQREAAREEGEKGKEASGGAPVIFTLGAHASFARP